MIEKIKGVYRFTFPNEKFYIGKSKDIYRRFRGHKNLAESNKKVNTVVNSAIKKYGWDSIKKDIIVSGKELTKEQINSLERFWIKTYNSTDKKFGYNLTEGGDGGCGTGENNHNFGIKLKEETKRKISEGVKKHMKDNPELMQRLYSERKGKSNIALKGRKITEEHKEKVRIGKMKPIIQYSLEGNFIKEWNFAKEAGEFYNIDPSNITLCARNIYKASHGFQWKRKTENYPLKIEPYIKIYRNQYSKIKLI